ncbi:MAG TPA: 3-hydroxyacyl-CoA dehydrogenase [Steroidobacteraceae bacterium]|jgi:3-hydroxybutyryl-CoA dehydrogenase|nr:3-hydroxyacyl-CoA dehydrogenase [Steroidobacteraceae bacterium]
MSEYSEQLHTIGVVGAGAMGAGIAQSALTAGLEVILHDSSAAARAKARAEIHSRIARLAAKGEITAAAATEAEGRLTLAERLEELAPAQIVIEAIIEQLEPKQKLLMALEDIVPASTVLATNTSSLPVAAIARPCRRRERVCGLHFFNPVPLMRLVEVIRAADTSERTMERALELAARLGKTAVRVKDVPGFLVNLLGRAYLTEALHIQHEGVASVAAIDRIMREAAGFRMGPFELMDLTGIDVNFPATRVVYEGFQHDPRLKTTVLHESLLIAGRLGRKTGRGFHEYGESKAASGASGELEAGEGAVSDTPVAAWIGAQAPELGPLSQRGLRLVAADQAEVILVSPAAGEDAATAAARLRLDPARVVAVDLLGMEKGFLTLMAPVGGGSAARKLAAFLRGTGLSVAVINDSPAFVAPRILAMVVNLACEIAQIGIGTPHDIDVAMRLAQNYPRGPFEWGEWLGAQRVHDTLRQLQEITGSDRYRPSLWLRRRALLALPLRTGE